MVTPIEQNRFIRADKSCQQGGFTLMELMVYIAILGIVVLIAGQAFSDSTKIRVRTQSQLKASEVAGNVGRLLKEDLAQMGAKTSKETNSSTVRDSFYTDAVSKVYMDVAVTTEDKDSSSFTLGTANGYDSLLMRRVRYDETGHYLAVEEISWYVDAGRVLRRSCKTLYGAGDTDNCPLNATTIVDVAENVKVFSIVPAKPTVLEENSYVLPGISESDRAFRLVPRYGDGNFHTVVVTASDENTKATVSGFAANYDFNAQEPVTDESFVRVNQVFLAEQGTMAGSWSSLCKAVTLEAGVEYEISFDMPSNGEDASRMFCPGRDHMSVGFRFKDDGSRPAQLEDFMFYPPAVGSGADVGKRSMRFSLDSTLTDVCLAFTFSSYSPIAASGKVNFANIALKKVAGANYIFDVAGTKPATPVTEKKNVKAMLVRLIVTKNGEAGVDSMIVPVPSNGPRD